MWLWPHRSISHRQALAYTHPDIEWHTRWLGPDVYRGRDGRREFFAALAEAFEEAG